MLCCRAPLAYVVTMMMSSNTSDSRGKAFGVGAVLFCSCQSWLGHPAVRVSFPWSCRVGGPGCTTSPYVSHVRKE